MVVPSKARADANADRADLHADAASVSARPKLRGRRCRGYRDRGCRHCSDEEFLHSVLLFSPQGNVSATGVFPNFGGNKIGVPLPGSSPARDCLPFILTQAPQSAGETQQGGKSMPQISRIAALALLGLSAVLSSAPSAAQTLPAKPLRFVVPFGPGGSGDTIARLIGKHLSERVGQPVVVENRMGAGGNIGADAVAKSPPDGTTLLMAANYLSIAPNLYKKMSYDPIKDLAPVTLIGSTPMVVVVNNNVPAKSIPELIALAKSKPGELAYATPGHGTSTHLACELLKQQTGIDIRHVPYRANPLALNDALGG
jgi:hypothetical protein